MRRGSHILVVAVLSLAVATARAAPIQPGPIALLEPASASPGARRCLTRIREELTADGFRVLSVNIGDAADPFSIVAAMAHEPAVASIAVVGDPDDDDAEVWIVDRLNPRTEVRRITADAEDSAHRSEILAIRTNEALRAGAFKLLADAVVPPPPPPMVAAAPPPVARPPEAPPSAPARRIGIETGIGVLESVGGPGPATLPMLGLRATLGQSAFARLTAAGLGSRPRVDNPAGSASIAETLGLIEIGGIARAHRELRLVAELGGGALLVQSDGEGLAPFVGLRESRWAAVTEAGLGALGNLGGELALAFEVHVLMAFAHPTVRFVGVDEAAIAYPALTASLTLIAWL